MADQTPTPPNRPDDPLRPRKPISLPPPAKSSGSVLRRVTVGDQAKRKKRGQAEPPKAEAEAPPDRNVLEQLDPATASEAQGARPERMEIPKSPEARQPVRSVAPTPAGTPTPAPPATATAPALPQTISGPQAAESPRRRRNEELIGEEAWTGAQTMSLWWVLAGLGCLLVVGVIVKSIGSFGSDGAGEKIEAPSRTSFREDIDEIPIAEFMARSEEILPEVSALLDKAVLAKEGEFAELVRGGEQSEERWVAWMARNPESARHHPTVRRQLHAAVVGGAGYLVLAGLDANHLAAVAYFVKEGDEFKYDWEASEGYSEILPDEVDQLADNEPKLMRVVVSFSNFYTPAFPEKEYRAYSLHHQDPGKFVWAFAKRNSVIDQKLIASYRAPDLGGTQDRATVMVQKGPEGARSNQLEIVDFLHTGWFTPGEVPER